MQLKLKREENISIRTWINDKPITDETWEVYSNTEDEDLLQVILKNGTTNAQFKLEIIKNIPYENN
jgi:hypothetical protein